MMSVPQVDLAIPDIVVFVVAQKKGSPDAPFLRNGTVLAGAQTGRKVYFVTHRAPQRIAPFLDDISERLDNQYRVTAVLNAIAPAGRTGGRER